MSMSMSMSMSTTCRKMAFCFELVRVPAASVMTIHRHRPFFLRHHHPRTPIMKTTTKQMDAQQQQMDAI
eukprot:scaffold308136_cov24-Attheya_sp.AAC.1